MFRFNIFIWTLSSTFAYKYLSSDGIIYRIRVNDRNCRGKEIIYLTLSIWRHLFRVRFVRIKNADGYVRTPAGFSSILNERRHIGAGRPAEESYIVVPFAVDFGITRGNSNKNARVFDDSAPWARMDDSVAGTAAVSSLFRRVTDTPPPSRAHYDIIVPPWWRLTFSRNVYK